MQAIGKPVTATVLSLSRDVIFLVPGVTVLALRFGVTGMLWSAPITDVLSIFLTAVLVASKYRLVLGRKNSPS